MASQFYDDFESSMETVYYYYDSIFIYVVFVSVA